MKTNYEKLSNALNELYILKLKNKYAGNMVACILRQFLVFWVLRYSAKAQISIKPKKA